MLAASSSQSSTILSDLDSKLATLQESFQKQELKAKQIEDRFQKLSHLIVLPNSEDEAQTGQGKTFLKTSILVLLF